MTCRAARIIGRRIDPETGETVEVPEHEHFYRCAVCNRQVDKRDLEQVLVHEGCIHD
jgi:hypothetical protein